MKVKRIKWKYSNVQCALLSILHWFPLRVQNDNCTVTGLQLHYSTNITCTTLCRWMHAGVPGVHWLAERAQSSWGGAWQEGSAQPASAPRYFAASTPPTCCLHRKLPDTLLCIWFFFFCIFFFADLHHDDCIKDWQRSGDRKGKRLAKRDPNSTWWLKFQRSSDQLRIKHAEDHFTLFMRLLAKI